MQLDCLAIGSGIAPKQPDLTRRPPHEGRAEEAGDLQPTSRTWANAQAFASMNNGYLSQYGVNAVVTGITVDAGDDTVLVQVSANLDRVFPSVVPDVTVTERGVAEIRAFTR